MDALQHIMLFVKHFTKGFWQSGLLAVINIKYLIAAVFADSEVKQNLCQLVLPSKRRVTLPE